MPIERLTASDELMLWPEARWPQHIGALAILDGCNLFDCDGLFRIDAVRAVVASRLHLAPRFRQLLRIPPRPLGRPLWVDAPRFDLNDHVRERQLPVPADEARLLLTIEELRRHGLDRSRPLWEMWFLTGLPDRRVALLVKLHHAIADGVAGVATIGVFLDASSDATVTPAPSWTPAPAPTADELRTDQRRRRAEQLGRALATLAHPVRSARQLWDAWPAVREVLAEEEVPATSLNRFVGPNRHFALIRSRLDQFKEVAHAHGATVNDVLLAVTAGGLRGILSGRGERVDGMVMRIDVPISFRLEQRAGARGNLIGEMVVPLPIGERDPFRRLERIAAETARRKARARPSLAIFPHRGVLGRTVLKLIDRQHVNVGSTNVPGPPVPVYFAGARVLEVFPLFPLIGKAVVGVAAISYAGQLNIMVAADRDACPDLDLFAAGLQDELESLSARRRVA